MPQFSPYTGGSICAIKHREKVKEIVESKFESPYKMIMEFAAPYIESVRKEDEKYIESSYMLHFCGCSLLGMLMSDLEFRRLDLYIPFWSDFGQLITRKTTENDGKYHKKRRFDKSTLPNLLYNSLIFSDLF